MNAETRRAIEWDITQLMHHYANLNDVKDWPAVAALYTPDGVMWRPVAPDAPVVGREAILASFLARPAARATKHFCANVEVTVSSPTEATAYSAYAIYGGARQGEHPLPLLDPAPPVICEFHDRLVLAAEGWRFAERRGALLFRGS